MVRGAALMANMIATVAVKTIVVSICCVLEKDTLRQFPLLCSLSKCSKFQSYFKIKKLKNQIKIINWIAIF